MAEDARLVSIIKERLLRLEDAVTRASEGGFHEAFELLDSAPEDDFGAIERIVRSFIYEHKIAIEQSAVVIEEFRVSKLELQQKLDTIEQQRAAIRELSAPIIDVWDDVLTVPLTGVLDSSRAQELAERLLARIHEAHAAWVILDLTGIELVDTLIANHLIKLASAVRLMGAECLLTGVGPHVAQTFAALGSSLEGLFPVATLRDGLKYCLARGASRRDRLSSHADREDLSAR